MTEHMGGEPAKKTDLISLSPADFRSCNRPKAHTKRRGAFIPSTAQGQKTLYYVPALQNGFPSCRIISSRPAVRMLVDGEDQGQMHAYVAHEAYNNRGSMNAESVRAFAGAGIHQFCILYFPHIFWKSPEHFDEEAAWQHLEQNFLSVLFEDPEALFIIRWSLFAPAWWQDAFPEDTILFSDSIEEVSNMPGNRPPPSYASEKWRGMQADIMTRLFRRLEKSPLAGRLVMVRLAYGNCGEWNNVGYHQKTFPDYSPVMQSAYSDWLQKKYGSIEKLSAAWNRKITSFREITIPSKEMRQSADDHELRPNLIRGEVCDYYDFWQLFTVATIEYFAAHLKTLTCGKIFVGAFYGYYLGHLCQGPYHSVDSGHYGLAACLQSKPIDFIGGPYPYIDRRSSAPINGAFSSAALHGKIWDTENDQRTHLSGSNQTIYGTTDSPEESIAIAIRDFACNATKGCHQYFYDFAKGWYLDPRLMHTIRKLRALDLAYLEKDIGPQVEVGVFLSEQAVIASGNAASKLNDLEEFMRCTMDAGGAPWDCYLLSDLKKAEATRYKLLIIPLYSSADADPALLHELRKKGVAVLLLDGRDFAAPESADMKLLAQDSKKKDNAALSRPISGMDVNSLRDVYDAAGVHIYSRNDGLFFAGRGLMCLYVRKPGAYEIRFPQTVAKIHDALSGKLLAKHADRILLKNPLASQSFLLNLE